MLSSSLGTQPEVASSVDVDLDCLPLAPIERFLLRNDQCEHPMVFRVLVRLDTAPQTAHWERAFRLAVARQPLLTSVVVGTDLDTVWKRTEHVPTLQWQHGLSASEVSRLPVDPILIRKEPGLRAKVFPHEQGASILLDFHHACCDGQGARQFLGEWFGLYYQLLTTNETRPVTLNEAKLLERGVYRKPTPPIGTFEGLKNLYLTVRGKTVRLPERFRDSDCVDYVLDHTLSFDETATLRQNLKRNGTTVNDAGLAATFSAFAECFPEASRRGYLTLMLPVDLRYPSDLRTPACNRVGVSFLRRKLVQTKDSGSLLEGLKREMRYIKNRYVGAEFLRGLQAAEGVAGGTARFQRWGWFIPTLQFTCLGDTTRALHYPFSPVEEGMRVGDVVVTSIAGFMQLGPFLPISVAACETNKAIALTARISARHLTQVEAERFLTVFVGKLKQFGSQA